MKAEALFGLLAMLIVDSATAFITDGAMLPRQAVSTSTAPATTPSLKPDSWQCATANISQYFDVPKPTGTVLTALYSYGNSLIAPCLKTLSGYAAFQSCTVSDPSSWCPFSTKAPAAVSGPYSTYALGAASWWNARSSAVSSLRRECPRTFEKFGPFDQDWLNLTVIHASCYLKVSPLPTLTTATSKSGTVTTGSSTGTSKPTSSSTGSSGTSKATTSSSTSKAK